MFLSQRKKRLLVSAFDSSGSVQLVWFKGLKWIKPTIKLGQQYIVYGKPTSYAGSWNFNHPEIELEEKSKNKLGSLQPVYHSTEKLSAFGLQSRGIENLMRNLLPQILKFIPKTLPNNIEKKNNFQLKISSTSTSANSEF